MNITVYVNNLDVEILPAYCNWTLVDKMKFDIKNNTFVEPYLPHNQIGIMHLAAGLWKNGKDMRVDKSVQIEIENLNNEKTLKSLRYNN